MDAQPLTLGADRLTLALRCDALGRALHGWVEATPLGRTLALGARRSVSLLHAKRDGQACFVYVDELTGAAAAGRSSGRPGDVFAFGGDPSGSGDERRGQLVLVYGPDNLFVEPLDRGLRERSYQRVGAIADVAELSRLATHIWRHGAQSIDLDLTAA